jgi:hypothetical protein
MLDEEATFCSPVLAMRFLLPIHLKASMAPLSGRHDRMACPDINFAQIKAAQLTPTISSTMHAEKGPSAHLLFGTSNITSAHPSASSLTAKRHFSGRARLLVTT